MKTLNKICILLVSAALFGAALCAQAGNKPVPPTKIMYSSSNLTKDVNAFTNVMPPEKEFSAEKKDLLRQLREARTLNNIQLKEQLEAQLNKLDGRAPVPLKINPNITGNAAPADNKIPFNNEPDFMNTMITGGGIESSATQTESSGMTHPGRIWVAATIYTASASDTCKIFFSDDGGQTWAFSYKFYSNNNIDFRTGELDIELVFDGNVLWIYGVAGYNDITANEIKSALFRFNTAANSFNIYPLLWPGAIMANKYYNPRITSDNSNYTASSYVYLSCSFDSTAGTGHYNKQKYARITNPFNAAPTIDYYNPTTGGFYWATPAPLGAYLWTDIAYFKTSAANDRIITVYNSPASHDYNQYLAWSDDYGASITGHSIITEANPDYGSRMVFNGGTAQTGMITYIRNFEDNDWDPYYACTVNGGTLWHSDYINQSSNRARTVDIIAPRGENNLFKIAYTQDSTAGTFGYYTGGSSALLNSPPSHTVTSANADTTFSKIVAGYTNGGDDCFALYSLNGGTALYGSRLCQTTIGIENTNSAIPKSYSLEQNYPNPFNPTTNIKFSNPKNSFVKLTVFDITGKVAATLVNNQLNAGNYTFDFDASNIATGVYFYKLEGEGFSQVKKMMLIK